MHRIMTMAGLVICAGLLAACNGAQDALPTLLPEVTVEATVEAPATVTVPATEAVPVSVTRSAPNVRPTLPPTFTPTTDPTTEATPTGVYPTASPFVSGATSDANCNTFDTVYDTTTFQFEQGTAPMASWTAVTGAELYRVILREANGRVINDSIYIRETTYTFPADLFKSGVVYSWDTYPINARGDQMCFAIGQPLVVSTPLPLPGSGN